MTSERLRILQINTNDVHGGAAAVAWNLHQAYKRLGLDSQMAVGRKISDDPKVQVIPNENSRNPVARLVRRGARAVTPLHGKIRGAWRLSSCLEALAEPRRHWKIWQGKEDFHFPGTRRLLELTGIPDVIHCHNLHGDYFDLRILPWLTQRVPLLITLHDSWMLSGHCAHSLDCERWKAGCGQCPYLHTYPAVRRDATDFNWSRKRNLYSLSRFYVSTPSRWLKNKLEDSILAAGIIESRVIPHGVDLSVFRPVDPRYARELLKIPQGCYVLLFTAVKMRKSDYKDTTTLQTAIRLLAKRLPDEEILFLNLGEDGPEERVGNVRIVYFPFEKDPEKVARYYQAADVFLHAAKADTFPNTVLESLACGIPVVATAVGGIPEQVKGLRQQKDLPGWNTFDSSEATGILVSPAEAESMAERIHFLLSNKNLRLQLSENAKRDASSRYDLQRQVGDYLNWYAEILRQRVPAGSFSSKV